MLASPNTTTGQLRYARIADRLRAGIISGQWAAGAALPAETALAQQYGVALGTMRQALALLVEERLLERQQGRGTFVRAGLRGASLLRFFRFAHDENEIPRSHIHVRKLGKASVEVAAQLGLATGAPVLQLLRTRWLKDTPRLLERIWLDAHRFATLAEGDSRAWGDLLYPEYAQRCGVEVHRATDTITFAALSRSDAKQLHLQAQHPGVVVSRRAFDRRGDCVEWRVTRADANAFEYTVNLT